jgi:ABC-type multidrug transport system ATPase subunit
LDEPTTGLDPHGRLELWDILRELVADGTTVLLTTQYLDEADRLAHRIVVVDKGRIIAEGTPAELKARVGSTVIEIELANEADALRAEPLLAAFGAGCGRDGRSICLQLQDGTHALLDVLRTLDSASLVPVTLAVREPSLDDAFLTLTGRHAEPVEVDGRETVGTRGGA